MANAQLVVERYNDCINAANLDDLASMMTEDHAFIDSAGSGLSGKTAVIAGWASFFAAFPAIATGF